MTALMDHFDELAAMDEEDFVPYLRSLFDADTEAEEVELEHPAPTFESRLVQRGD